MHFVLITTNVTIEESRFYKLSRTDRVTAGGSSITSCTAIMNRKIKNSKTESTGHCSLTINKVSYNILLVIHMS